MTTEPHEYVDDCDCQACAVKSRDIYKKAWQKAEMQVVACGVAVHHPDPLLTTTGAYAREWNSQQLLEVRALRIERDQLKSWKESVLAEVGRMQEHVHLRLKDFSDESIQAFVDQANEIIDSYRDRGTHIAAQVIELRAKLVEALKDLEHKDAYYAQFDLVPKSQPQPLPEKQANDGGLVHCAYCKTTLENGDGVSKPRNCCKEGREFDLAWHPDRHLWNDKKLGGEPT